MEIFLVGGAVRDQLLGVGQSDRDWVVTGATDKELLDQGYRQVGADFPVFLHPETGEEYALARTERKRGRGYHGFEAHAAPDVTLEQDLKRRDLTINAIAQRLDGSIIDPYGGREDLHKRVLRHVSPAFVEDPLRVLRVARFMARLSALGFTVAPETMTLMRCIVDSGEIDALVAERVWAETRSALATEAPHAYFQTLQECGALPRIMPELNTLDASLQTLHHAARLSELPTVRFAALFLPAPVAPAPWQATVPDVYETTSVDIMCERLKIPNDFHQLARMAVQFHQHAHLAMTLHAAPLLRFLERLDVLRRPQRFADFLLACQANALAQESTATYPQAAFMQAAIQVYAAVDAAAIAAAARQEAGGSANIKLRLAEAREQALGRWLREQT